MSNIGERYNPIIRWDKLPKVHCINYIPDLNISAQKNEENKRNIGLEKAKELECTHFLCMDCDEYYEPKEFEHHKNLILNGNFDASACRLFTYYKKPTIQLTPLEEYYVPFIHKIYPETKLCFDKSYPAFVDPTRRTNTHKSFLKIETPIMHHFSFVRKDIERKWRNSSSAQAFPNVKQLKEDFDNFEKTGKMVFFKEFSYKEVPNLFNIHID